MRSKSHILTAAFTTAILFLLIFDTKTASFGVSEGIVLCLEVLIPSLFPFILVTTYLNAALNSPSIPGLRTLRRVLNIPTGGDSLLLLGLLGGYPVGAQLITDAYRNNQVTKRTAHILLGYFCNAGPAFIFGVTSMLFSSKWIPFALWLTHILSALITGFLLPRPKDASIHPSTVSNISAVTALRKTTSVCASICGWVVTFKIIMSYLKKWLSHRISRTAMICLSGLLELSNGCLLLKEIPTDAERFILCSAFLAFGGLCVMLQTASVAEPLGLGMYFSGKIMQTSISTLIATILSYMIFTGPTLSPYHPSTYILVSILTLASVKLYIEKKCGKLVTNHV